MLLLVSKKAKASEIKSMKNKALILDIAMNLSRIGNWAADDYDGKKKRIETFMRQTSNYINDVDKTLLKEPFKSTFHNFLKEYRILSFTENKKDKLTWAEKMMTWGNILTHRAKLI